MADNQLAFSNWLSQGHKFLPHLNSQPAPINYSFDEEFRRKTINKLVNMLHSRRNEVDVILIADWANKEEGFIRKTIPQRNDHKNKRHAVDVLKFLCDQWDIDYPEEYYTYGKKFGFVMERA
ncbi:MAG: hypothetical protein MJZ66_04080 [Bacteroidales bacterium]|nr:hypothetical protein [Bacteroidales bacterium]